MPLIRSLVKAGFKVIVITQFDGYEKQIVNEVDKVYPLFISRKGINPIVDLITLLNIFSKLAIIRPDYLLLFTIKPVIYGSLAARILNIPHVPTITGLGTAFISRNWITKIASLLYKISLRSVAIVFFQNNDDKELFILNGLVDSKVCKLSPGSGIDLDKFMFHQLPNELNMSFLFVGRMLRDKGVVEFVDAARIVKKQHPMTSFQLLGPMDVENRTAISKAQINQWVNEGVVDYLGQTDNVSKFIQKSSCVVLPSYREGISRVLLEASAVGRPIVASDVPGCREIVDNNLNGFLCKPKDSTDLANKIQAMLLLSYEKRVKMGLFGRKKMEEEFDQGIVCKIYQDELKKIV
ncbi:glycosyltransferase family 4 protein [Candidatus Pseudothioglobus singularis]|nr:glycosyltransferase family 4 protein [Candidatus Pseudothioglobus singularis]